MKREKLLPVLALTLDLLTVVFSTIGSVEHFGREGFAMLRWYTVLSNVFLAVAACITGYYALAGLLGKRFFLPTWARVTRYIASVMIAMTFVVVVFIFVPWIGLPQGLTAMVFNPTSIWHHFLAPVCGLLGYFLCVPLRQGDKKLPLLATLPTLAYAIVVTALNVLRVLHGPYPFFYVYEQPLWASVLWFIALWLLALLLAWGLWRPFRKGESFPLPASPLPTEAAFTEDGYIKDQDALSAYRYRCVPASHNSCGVVAVYDLLHFEGRDMPFDELCLLMEGLHRLHMPGPTLNSAMRRSLNRLLPGFREAKGREAALSAGQACRMGILRYVEQKVPHFVPLLRQPDGSFRYFNVNDGQEDFSQPLDAFFAAHVLAGPVRLYYWE